jgi:hypothetical protein
MTQETQNFPACPCRTLSVAARDGMICRKMAAAHGAAFVAITLYGRGPFSCGGAADEHHARRVRPTTQGLLVGPPAAWIEQMADLALSHGISAFIIGGDNSATAQRLAAEVAPAVREIVERASASSAPWYPIEWHYLSPEGVTALGLIAFSVRVQRPVMVSAVTWLLRQRGCSLVDPVSWPGSRAPTMTPARATAMPNENASATPGPCPIPAAAAATIAPATPVPSA